MTVTAPLCAAPTQKKPDWWASPGQWVAGHSAGSRKNNSPMPRDWSMLFVGRAAHMIASGESRNLFALLFTPPDHGWAFGLDGVVLKSRSGPHWERVRPKEEKTGSATGANHLFAAAAWNGRLWAVGERGTLLRSDADGLDWQPATVEIPRVSLNHIAFGQDGFGLIVGNRGMIFRTDNGGDTWKRLKISLSRPEKN
jgi:photosystem II stability/assembly factor-like uncharacterized protein